jgi:prepilin-type N-terminal cleavage/methylation domain-containing protein
MPEPKNHAAFTLPEVLVCSVILAALTAVAVAGWSGAMRQADRADAVAKIRVMGTAVLHYAGDHGGKLPPLFPGQVLDCEEGRGGRIVTECAAYLGLTPGAGRYFAEELLPRSYTQLREPSDRNALRVYVMNSAVTNATGTLAPFGTVVVTGQPPAGPATLAAAAERPLLWMMSTADRFHPNVAMAPWRGNAPAEPPLGDVRAIFRFDGGAGLETIPSP